MGLLTEKFSSNILAKLAKEHGGIERWINGGMRQGANAWYGGSSIDVASVTDDMLTGEPFEWTNRSEMTNDQFNNAILFNDGMAIALKPYRLNKADGSPEPKAPKKKPSRYSTGIGDTGDHDRTPSPWVKNGGKIQGQEYNGYGVSDDAGEAQGIRHAYNVNKAEGKEYMKNLVVKKADDLTNKTAAYIVKKLYGVGFDREYSLKELAQELKMSPKDVQHYQKYAENQIESQTYNDLDRDRLRNSRRHVDDLKNRASKMVRNHDRSNVNKIALEEGDLEYLVMKSALKLLEVTDYGNNIFGSAGMNPTTKETYGVDNNEYYTRHSMVYDIVEKFGSGVDRTENYTNRGICAYFYGKMEDRPEVYEQIKQYCASLGYLAKFTDMVMQSFNPHNVVKIEFEKM